MKAGICFLAVLTLMLAVPFGALADYGDYATWADAADRIDQYLDTAFGNIWRGRTAIYAITVLSALTVLMQFIDQLRMLKAKNSCHRHRSRAGSNRRVKGFQESRIGRKSPSVLLADEPAGDLDDENTKMVLSVFQETANCGAAVY